ncbi:MAG: DNA gyrase subunit B [Sphaerochaetaceae bacterium]|nr:DNA gyrase subunit B [Sphaerochaetaceae bacterium]
MDEEIRKSEDSLTRGSSDYNADDIKVLHGLEAVRKRPGMYIGTTGPEGLHHMVYEVVDNSIDEAVAGFCNTINIRIEKGNILCVEDNGRGIPVAIHPTEGVSTLQVALCNLHAGGKFGGKGYKTSGGLHGVGVSVVNALSDWLEATVYRDGKIYRQTYKTGIPQGDVAVVGTTDPSHTGTTIKFHADAKTDEGDKLHVMELDRFDFNVLCERFRELAFLNKGVVINATDDREEVPVEKTFHFEGGIKDFVSFLDENNKIIPEGTEPVYAFGNRANAGGEAQVEFSLQYTDRYDERIYSFANNINTREGGKHLVGFTTGLVAAVRSQLQKTDRYKKDKKTTEFIESADFAEGFNSDVREGLSAVISVKLSEPQFEGQTKMKLGSSYIQGLVQSFVYEKLNDFFDENPSFIEAILDKTVNSARARVAAKHAREKERKKNDGGVLPSKLADCSEKDPANREIFIVEGDSAGGSANQGRDRKTQAILSLWGKMLNVEKTREEKVAVNDKLQPVIASIGAGLGATFNIEKARYHKIIIMADADVDGSHIRTLLLTFFFRYMRPLIDAGYVYFAMPPLYKISIKSKEYYAYDEEERVKILAENNLNAEDEKSYKIQRYKGLGEMNPEQLWETTMDPERRFITRVQLSDAIEADHWFSVLMGEDVEPRRVYIEENATYANIDA